jgi:hypothetical protein
MNQIGETEFRDAVIATKKDVKLVAAAKNDRTNSPDSLYREFAKLPVDRQRDIIIAICNDHFVASLWKIAFPLNNTPTAALPDAVQVAGKALFLSREEDCVRESVRAVKVYLESPFLKQICSILSDAAEMTGIHLAQVAMILTTPEVYGMIRSLETSAVASEKIVFATGRTAIYTRDLNSTLKVGRFLQARGYSPLVGEIATLIENSIFMARDPESVGEIVAGFGAGSIDTVLQNQSENKQVLSKIRDVAWKTRDWKVIRDYLTRL